MQSQEPDFVARGRALIDRRQFQEAVRACRLGLLGQPQRLDGHLVLGVALLALGRFDEVLAEMRVAIELDERSAMGWLLRGEALALRGDHAQAEVALERAQALEPRSDHASRLLADIRTALAAGLEGDPADPTQTREYPTRRSPLDVALEVWSEDSTNQRGEAAPPVAQDTPFDFGGDHTWVDGSRPGDPFDERTAKDVAPPAAVREALAGNASGAPPATATDVALPAPPPPGRASSSVALAAADDDEAEPPTREVRAPPPRQLDEPTAETVWPGTPAPSLKAAPPSDEPAAITVPTPCAPSEQPARPASPQDESTPLPRPFAPARPATTAKLPSLGDLEEDEVQDGRFSDQIALEPVESIEEIGWSGVELGGAATDGAGAAERAAIGPPWDEPSPPSEDAAAPEIDGDTRPVPRAPSEPAPEPPDPPTVPVPREPAPPAANQLTSTAVPVAGRPVMADRSTPERPLEAPTATVSAPARRDSTSTALAVPVPFGTSRPRRLPRRRGSGTLVMRATLPPQRTVLLFAGAAVAVLAVAGVTGFGLRELRVGARVERHREAARQRLAAGTFAGYQTAAEEYRRILADRPSDDGVRAARARVLAAMALEFGDALEPAGRAVSALGDDGSDDARAARAYVALARGDVARARRQTEGGGTDELAYLRGRAALAAERPDEAVGAIGEALANSPRDPLFLHGLGLAEAARHRDGAAMEAFGRALAVSPNHVPTLLDRAALQVRRGRDLAAAKSYLEGVASKLSSEASPAELGRAWLMLGELALGRGDLARGRALLMRASAKRSVDGAGDLALGEELAAAYLRAFELDAAETEARRAIAASRGRAGAWLVLAQVALSRGRPDDALRDVDEAGLARPEALLVRGRALLALGRIAQAGAAFDEALRRAPELAEARAWRARVEIAEGRAAQARRELERMEAARLAPAAVAEALARAFLALHQLDRARYWFTRAVERDPLALEARLELSRLKFEDGQIEEARADLRRAVQANAEFLPAWRDLAALSLESADLLAAREEYDALVEKVPTDADALLGAARARALLGDATGAEDRLGRADRLGAPAEEVSDLRALVLLRTGRPREALATLGPIAMAQRPETAALWLGALSRLGRTPPPRALGRAIPPRLRGTPEVAVAEARGLVEEGRDRAASSLARSVIARAERGRVATAVRAEAHAVLGRALFDGNDLRGAWRQLDAALKLDPHNPRACYQMGLLLDERHARAEALRLTEEAVRADPSYPDGHYELGRLRAQGGDPTAVDAFADYLKLDPRGPWAEDARRGIRALARRGGARRGGTVLTK